MSYLVLARRWRPQRFSDLVGQDVVVRTLQNSMKTKQLAHAYLLTGIRGTGKTTIARLLAMVVNCVQPENGEPCGQCAACTSIAGGNNLDVQEMDAASHTGVDDIREILDGVRYPPSTLQYKVYLIDEAHMLTKNAFNALLKTLEEPPEHVLFLLATTEAEKLPITVRSRCQRFDLRRLGSDEISHYLARVLNEEKVAYEAEALHAIAHAADGSVRDALSLTERVLAFGGDTLSSEHVRHALGLVGPDLLRRLSDAVFCGDAQSAIETLRAASSGGHAPRSILLGTSELWHDMACMMINASLLEHEPGEIARAWLKDRLDCWDTQALDLRYQVLIQGLRDLTLVDERQAANMLLIRLCSLNEISPPRRIPEIDETEKAAATSPTTIKTVAKKPVSDPVETAQQQPDEATATISTESGSSPVAEKKEVIDSEPEETLPKDYASWEEAVEAYGKLRAGVAAMLEHVLCLDFGDRVRLALDSHQERALVAAERLSFAEWLGREIHWEPKADQQGESLSEQRARRADARQKKLEKAAENDPHVQALIGTFDARIESVRAPGAAENMDRSENNPEDIQNSVEERP